MRDQLINQPAVGLTLVVSIVLQAAGFCSLSRTTIDFSAPRLSAVVCAVAALVQSLALLAASIFGFGAAWIFGILGELVITPALGAFAISSLFAQVPREFSLISTLMVPFFFIGWAVDPQSGSVAGMDVVNLSAAIYGVLWMPFGYVIWGYLRNRVGSD